MIRWDIMTPPLHVVSVSCCSLWTNCQLWFCHSAHPMVQTTCKVWTQIQLTSVWAARLWSVIVFVWFCPSGGQICGEFRVLHISHWLIQWYIYTYNNQCYGCWKFCILMIFKRMVIQTWSSPPVLPPNIANNDVHLYINVKNAKL